MANDLVSYIIEQIKQGYDINTIRSYLLSYGYSPEIVEDSLKQAYNQYYYGKKPSAGLAILAGKNLWLIAIIIVAVLLVGTALAYFFIFKETRPGAGPHKPDVNFPGGIPTPAATTTISPTTRPVPTTPAKTTTPSQPRASCNDGVLNQGETGVDCGGSCAQCKTDKPHDPGGIGYNTDDIPGFKPGVPDPGTAGFGSQKTGQELLNEIIISAKTDPKKAAKDCTKLREVLQDDCYSGIAEISNSTSYCELVKTDNNRDGCYVNFVLMGRYELCDKLSAETLRNSCYSFKEISRQGSLATGKAYEIYSVLLAYRNAYKRR